MTMFIANLQFGCGVSVDYARGTQPMGHSHGHMTLLSAIEVAHVGLLHTGNIIATSPHDVEMMRVFCSAKNAYQILQCKIGVSGHIKVDICLFFVAILWLFCRHVFM